MTLVVRILLVLHVLLAVVYAWDWYKDNEEIQEGIMRLVISLCLPLVGVLLFKLVDYFFENSPEAQMDELYLGKGEISDELHLLRPVNREAEMDKAPAIDTLKLGAYDYRRKMIMDTLKEEDTLDYITILKEALVNEDMETSHYASSVIMDLQERVQEGLTEQEKRFAAKPDSVKRQASLEHQLCRVIQSGVFDENSLVRYYARYGEISDLLLKRKEVKAEWYHNRIQIDLKIGANLHAKETAINFVKAFPDQEDAVVDMIQVCVRLYDRKTLDQFLAELKKMPVVLTSKSLQYIRFLA